MLHFLGLCSTESTSWYPREYISTSTRIILSLWTHGKYSKSTVWRITNWWPNKTHIHSYRAQSSLVNQVGCLLFRSTRTLSKATTRTLVKQSSSLHIWQASRFSWQCTIDTELQWSHECRQYNVDWYQFIFSDWPVLTMVTYALDYIISIYIFIHFYSYSFSIMHFTRH